MAFGLIRARNLSAADISSTDIHNARRYETKEQYPPNVPLEKREDRFIRTEYILEKYEDFLGKKESTLTEAINERLKINNVKGIRKNSNLAIEYVVGINDKKAWDNYSFDGFVNQVSQWLEERHGLNSVVAVYSHDDESNPHAHIVVVPVEEKAVKWKNQQGSGERIEKRLNTRYFTGGREKLRDLQNDYFEYLTKRFDGGKKLGLELFRGTLVENQAKEYVERTNHEIGELRSVLVSLTDENTKNIVLSQINAKEAEIALKEIELKQEEDRRSGERKGLWKLKGIKYNQEIFHSKSERENNPNKKGRGI
ncbi:plasmid recombination protein (plasmid) [Flavobacterium sp. TMP13]|uniref:plasmid recombination protein n=1 Tax=Flavobacterium sp. TMP13 TaxID=3425950 RepID=UPI003D77B483